MARALYDETGRVGDRLLTVQPDLPDLRDRMYEPHLRQLADELPPPAPPFILDQGPEGACTGFALAAVINRFKQDRLGPQPRLARGDGASARMLYEMARRYDEWPGEDYPGSSIRGGVRGLYHNGVCTWHEWPYRMGRRREALTVERAIAARNTTLGAYYRLRPVLHEYHAALMETGAILCSARVHQGWQRPDDGEIGLDDGDLGGHAFAIVGYDSRGFWVQNSWGEDWGRTGLARWRYEDWLNSVMDAWVLRLAIPTPLLFGLTPRDRSGESGADEAAHARKPRRHEIAGHYVHIDDGKYANRGKYWTTRDDVRQTAMRLFSDHSSGRYKHLLFYAHGGLNDTSASANRVRWMKDVFRANGIYPLHFMWDTGLFEEITDVVFNRGRSAEGRVGGFSDVTDRLIEGLSARVGGMVWAEMKAGARKAFGASGHGLDALSLVLTAMRAAEPVRRLRLHFVGHSAGSILLGEMLKNADRLGDALQAIDSVSLMAPACTVELFDQAYLPRLGDGPGRIRRLTVYNLNDKRERNDQVAVVYRKSLLYLVSNALEGRRATPLLGMENFSRYLPAGPRLAIHYAGADEKKTDSDSHSGFDNDAATMNDILGTILGAKPVHPFTADVLRQY